MSTLAFQNNAYQTDAFQMDMGVGCTPAFQNGAFQADAFQVCPGTTPTPTPTPTREQGGVGSLFPGAWRKRKKLPKKELLSELDQLIVQLRDLPAPLAVPDQIIARAEEFSMKDTLDAIEAEVMYLSELLEEVDEEEAMLLLM